MGIIVGIIIGIIVLTVLVVVHELGHALVARRYGTVVEEFGIGFPPKVWSRRAKKSLLGHDVEYSLNLLPIGGFVRMRGEHDDDTNKGDYGAMTFWQKTQVLLAGVVSNWVLAAFLITILAFVGLPKVLSQQFYIPADATIINQPVELATVTPGLPAADAGLRQGDIILKVDNQTVVSPSDLTRLTNEYHGKTVNITYRHYNVEHEALVTLRTTNSDHRGYLGVAPVQQQLIKATWSAPIVGVGTTAQMTWVTFQGLGQLAAHTITGVVMKFSPSHASQVQASRNLSEAGDSVAGPLAIFGIIFPAVAKEGLTYIVLIAAVISLSLAVMNVLPIPALDGGRWFVTALYRVLKKPLTKEVEERIHGTGFVVLMILVIIVTIADVGKLR